MESEDDTTVTSQSTGSTLLIWSKKEIEIGEDSTWEAFLYAVKDIKLKDDATLTGAATTEDDIKLEDNATVVYNATGAQYATFGSHCQGNAPPPSLTWIRAHWPTRKKTHLQLSRLTSQCPTATTRISSAR